MRLDPGADSQPIDALFRADTGDRDVDNVDDLRRHVVNDVDEGETTVNARTASKDLHGRSDETRSMRGGPRCTPSQTNHSTARPQLPFRPSHPTSCSTGS